MDPTHLSTAVNTYSRPSQPPTAFLLQKASPEILDLILSHVCPTRVWSPQDRRSAKALRWKRCTHRGSDILQWNGVSHALFTSAARFIWKIVVLESDNDRLRVQAAIDATGGIGGRVGSSIRGIYTTFRWTTCPEAILQLAASCSNLLRIDAPFVDLGQPAVPTQQSLGPYQYLQTLVLFGHTSRVEWEFDMRDLACLASLKHLTVDTRVTMASPSPRPAFSLVSLLWEGRYNEKATRWVLQNSHNTLEVLMLYAAAPGFLCECLRQHGATLRSLRLLLHGTIGRELYPEMMGTILKHCTRLREILWDLDLDATQLGRLPPSLEHLALKIGMKTTLFKQLTDDWVYCLPNLKILTVWGCHACFLYDKSVRKLTTRGRIKTQTNELTRWRYGKGLGSLFQIKLAHMETWKTVWPFKDEVGYDYISPVIPDHRCR